MTNRKNIEDFLGLRSLAVVGASRNEKHFSRYLMRIFRAAGYTVQGINPQGGEMEGECFVARVGDLTAPAEGALLMVPAAALPQAVRDCAAAGIQHLWISGTGRPKPLDEELLALCRERGISLINGFCPLMFLRQASWPHRLHGWIAQRTRDFRQPAPA